jgi:hypothetical protein
MIHGFVSMIHGFARTPAVSFTLLLATARQDSGPNPARCERTQAKAVLTVEGNACKLVGD